MTGDEPLRRWRQLRRNRGKYRTPALSFEMFSRPAGGNHGRYRSRDPDGQQVYRFHQPPQRPLRLPDGKKCNYHALPGCAESSLGHQLKAQRLALPQRLP